MIIHSPILEDIEDALVKVDKFMFLIIFFILDIEKYREIHITLGIPLLVTKRDMIDA